MVKPADAASLIVNAPMEPKQSKGAYDIRKGAAGYAGIMGSVAGFVVPTVILAFTLPHKEIATHKAEITLATGLLVLSLLGCLATAFAMAAFSGEKLLTINLPPAAMITGVGAIISITAILGAFAIFAHIYLPASASLFGVLTAGGGTTGVVFNALAAVDDWEIRQAEGHAPGWIKSRRHAQWWVSWLSVIGSVPILAGLIIYLLKMGVHPSTRSASWFCGVSLVATVAIIIRGQVRAIHPDQGPDRGLGRGESVIIQLASGLFTFALLLFLPH